MALTTFTFNKNSLYDTGSNYFSALTDIYLILKSDQSSLHSDFKFQISIMNGTTQLIRTYELVPNQSGKLVTNITPIVKDYLITPGLLKLMDTYNVTDYKRFRIYVAEYYDGTQQSLTYKDVYVVNSKPRNLQDELLHLLPYENGGVNNYLTNSSMQVVNLDITKPILLPFITINIEMQLKISLKSSSYGIVSHTVNITDFNKLINYNITRFIYDNFTLQQRRNAEMIMVELIGGSSNVYNYVIDRCNELIPICWYNELGGIETLHMFDYTNETETQQVTFIRHQHLYDDGYVKGGMVVSNATQVERITLWSQWMSDTEAEYFSKSLMQAKNVYIITCDDDYNYEPISIIANSIKHSRNEYNDLVNVVITCEKNRYDNL